MICFMISTAGSMAGEGDVPLNIAHPAGITISPSTPIVLGETSDQGDMDSGSREEIDLVCLPIGIAPKTGYILESITLGNRIAIVLIPFLETAIHATPIILACLSSQSEAIASISFAQNLIYTGMYGGFLIKNLYKIFHENMSSSGKILTGMCLANTVLGTASCFSSWQYLETAQYGYRMANTCLNITSGSIGLISRTIAKGPEIFKSCYSRKLPPFFRIYPSSQTP